MWGAKRGAFFELFNKPKRMNRLILVGNGFDLAHGLKTSYNSFLLHYIKKVFNHAYKNKYYSDGLIRIHLVDNFYPVGDYATIDSIVDYFYSQGLHDLFTKKVYTLPGYNQYFQNPFQTTIDSLFFKSLLLSCSKYSWVDIENEYYRHLKQILDSVKDKGDEVKRLNKTLLCLINELEDYLHLLPTVPDLKEYRDIIYSPLVSSSISAPNKILVLNFNYTSTFEPYLTKAPINTSINYIHGELKSLDNPIVFGFGDEMDLSYLKLESEPTRGFLDYMKAFWYFRTSNYHDLIRFIDSELFEVFILGHSCGLSDRTMLNMIFEHKNCEHIKIYYYEEKGGKNNFTPLTQEISRHFKNKGDMRKKIVPFPQSECMPQY